MSIFQKTVEERLAIAEGEARRMEAEDRHTPRWLRMVRVAVELTVHQVALGEPEAEESPRDYALCAALGLIAHARRDNSWRLTEHGVAVAQHVVDEWLTVAQSITHIDAAQLRLEPEPDGDTFTPSNLHRRATMKILADYGLLDVVDEQTFRCRCSDAGLHLYNALVEESAAATNGDTWWDRWVT